MSTRARYHPWFRKRRTIADVNDGETVEELDGWVCVTYRDGRRAMILKSLYAAKKAEGWDLMPTERCKSCGAAIFWATTQSGKMMPLNATPDPKGNLAVSRWATVVAVHQRTDLTETQGMPTHTSHFTTCPNAAKHRKPKLKGAR